jgi:sugar phosphate isomerase/epimerase
MPYSLNNIDMKKLLFTTLICLVFGIVYSQKKALDNTFYAFNNSVRMPNAPVGMEAQAELIKRLGFDGFSGHTNDDYFSRRAALDKAGLKMPEIYWGIDMDSTGKISYKDGLKEIIKDSKDRDLVIALFSNVKSYMNNKDAGDPLLSKAIGELADFAAPFGVKIAIYPHVGNYCETSEHSVRLAKMANRPNVGAIFNTCHLLKKEGEEGWEQKLLNALPYLYMISINGADSGNTKEMNWDRLIQPLGEGTFDTYSLVKLAKDNGYNGLFGLQCYDIKQDCEVALTKSINTWNNYKKRYATEK